MRWINSIRGWGVIRFLCFKFGILRFVCEYFSNKKMRLQSHPLAKLEPCSYKTRLQQQLEFYKKLMSYIKYLKH
jgi:hypothetical protein